MTAAVQVRGLTKRYRAVTALDQVSLELAAGRVHLLVGLNGAGKTTLLRVLVGLARPTSGSVRICGRPVSSLQRPAHVVGACLDPIRLPALRSGRQHLACLAAAARLPRQRVDEVLDLAGLPAQVASRRAGTYSLGTRQRLMLAAALLGDPQVIVLDEPTTGLDIHGVAWLRRQLRGWAGAGRTVLVASHSLTELAAMADQVLVLDRGQLVRQVARAELDHGADLQTALFELLLTAQEGPPR
jgi:ABC-2 type transport system ATP-binding protein